MKIIGITGASGSGKSTVSQIIGNKYNAQIIDADKIAKDLTNADTEYLRKIVETFGTNILDSKGKLNRKELAEIIFTNKKQKEKLDNLTNKYVVEEIKNQIKKSKKEITILDVPLLFETKLNKICDITIGVISSQKEKIERICKRDKIDEKQAIARISSQKNNEYFIKKCNYIIENTKIEMLEKEISQILLKLQ